MSLSIINIFAPRDYHESTNDIVIETSGSPANIDISFNSGTSWTAMNHDGSGLWIGSQYWQASSGFNWSTSNSTGFTGDIWVRENGQTAVVEKYKIKGFVYTGTPFDGISFITKQNAVTSANVDIIIQCQAGPTGDNNPSATLNGANPTFQAPVGSSVAVWKFQNVTPASTAYSFVQGGQTVAITYDSAVFTGGSTSTNSLVIQIPSGGTLVVTTLPTHGTLTIANQAITYTPTSGYSGADSFGYDIKGTSGDVVSSGICSFSTSAATATAIPSFPKSFVDVSGDIQVNCVAGSVVKLYKNTDTNLVGTVTDTTNAGFVLFTGIARLQDDTFKSTAQKSGLSLSGFSIICTTKRKPTAISGVTKNLVANGTVSVNLTELVNDSANATFF